MRRKSDDNAGRCADIARFAEKWANEGKVVIIAALVGTFQRRPFPAVLELLALAEAVEKLHSVCDGCGADASFTQRLGTESAVEVGYWLGGQISHHRVYESIHWSERVSTQAYETDRRIDAPARAGS